MAKICNNCEAECPNEREWCRDCGSADLSERGDEPDEEVSDRR